MSTKQCPGFRREAHVLSTSAFGTNKGRADGLSPYCKTCAAASQRAWKKAHPDKVKADKKKYREQEKAA